MICAWNSLLAILPPGIRSAVDKPGKERSQELRLRINSPPELVMPEESRWLTHTVSCEDLNYVVNASSRYSPWNAMTCAQGFLTAPGGHRIGLCGEAVYKNGKMEGFRDLTSLCIRIARDFPGIARDALPASGSVLILGPPGWGKTTFLRDLIRQASIQSAVAVIDQRGEIFPKDFDRGRRTDVLAGCPKPEGMDIALRTLGPRIIAVDEITAQEDTQTIVHCANCGVRLFATAHGSSLEDLTRRAVYRPLIDAAVFDTLIILQKNWTYTRERIVR